VRLRPALLCAGLLACLTSHRVIAQPTTATSTTSLKKGEIRLTYLGNAGWEITDGTKVVLVDPFLTQFARWAPGSKQSDGPAQSDLYLPDTALIDAHVTKADYILITVTPITPSMPA